MITIKTGSWFAETPADHIKIGISRGSPRGMAAGYRLYRALAPGAWFNSVSIEEYARRYYDEILRHKSPRAIVEAIEKLADGKTPVLCCYESASQIHHGATFCHRHFAAKWLEDSLGIRIDEVGAPEQFDRWMKLRSEGLEPPSYPRA